MTYKKMSDFFDLPMDSSDGCLHLSRQGGYVEFFQQDDADAIALAVNNHDKLVRELEETIMKLDWYWNDVDSAQELLEAIKGDQ